MTIILDHTIVPAHDKDRAASFFAQMLGLGAAAPQGPFAAVQLNPSLTLDFAEQERFEPHHYAFRVEGAELDAILARVKGAGVVYSSDPYQEHVGAVYRRGGDRGFYFRDPEGHILEVMAGD